MNLNEKVQQLTSKGYDFKFGQYLSEGFNYFKAQAGYFIGFFVISILMVMIAGFIPVVGSIASQILSITFLIIVGPYRTKAMMIVIVRATPATRIDSCGKNPITFAVMYIGRTIHPSLTAWPRSFAEVARILSNLEGKKNITTALIPSQTKVETFNPIPFIASP